MAGHSSKHKTCNDGTSEAGAKLSEATTDITAKMVDSEDNIAAQREMNRAHYQAKCDLRLAHYQARNQSRIENFKEHFGAVTAFGQNAIKIALLINGGAAVAILTKLGATSSLPGAAFKSSLSLFAFGVLAAAVASGGAYWTQYSYAKRVRRKAFWLHATTILLVVISYLLFAIASWGAADLFNAPQSKGHPMSLPVG